MLQHTNNQTNAAQAMRSAWIIAQDAAKRFDCKVSSIHFGTCLRLAWQAQRSDKPQSVLQWEALDTEEQTAFVARIVKTWCKNIIGKTPDANAYNQISHDWLWSRFGHDFDELSNSVWCRALPYFTEDGKRVKAIDAQRSAAGKAPLTLAGILYRAANAGLMQLYRAEIKHGSAVSLETSTSASDEDLTLADIIGSNEEGLNATDAAQTAKSVCKDDADETIIKLLSRGNTQAQIARYLGISQQAVQKRLAKFRTRYNEAIA